MNKFSDKVQEYISTVFKDLKYSHKTILSISFEECTFENCEFIESKFMNCRFIDCQFINCNLSVAKMDDSTFRDVIFRNSKTSGLDWTKAAWPEIALSSSIKFINCIINDSNFSGLQLNEIVIEQCQAYNVDFREGSFRHANFRLSDLTGSLFNETDLGEADFTDAINYQIDVNFNKIKGAKFSRQEAIRLLYSLGIELVD